MRILTVKEVFYYKTHKKIKKFQKTIDKWKILGYNGKLSNDGYISLIRRSEWVGELCPFYKNTAEIVILVAIVNIHTLQKVTIA